MVRGRPKRPALYNFFYTEFTSEPNRITVLFLSSSVLKLYLPRQFGTFLINSNLFAGDISLDRYILVSLYCVFYFSFYSSEITTAEGTAD